MKKSRPKKTKLKKSRAAPQPAALVQTNNRSIVQTVLYFAGLIGGTLTLFGGLQTFIDLSKWASYIINHWNEWTFNFWAIIAWLLGWEPTHETAAVLTFFVSMQLLSLSAMTMTPEDESPMKHHKGIWPWQWGDRYLLHWTNALFASFLAVLIFNLSIEHLIFNNALSEALSHLPRTTWGMGATVLVGLGFTLVTQGWRAVGECIAVAACVGAFYFIIASGSAHRAAIGGSSDIEIYRNVVFKYSFAILPLSLAGMLSGAASRYLLLRFLALAILLGALFAMNLVAIAGFSALPPSSD